MNANAQTPSQSPGWLTFPVGLTLTLALGVGLPVMGSLTFEIVSPEWRWPDLSFHRLIELLGGLLACALGFLLVRRLEANAQGLYFWVGCGLIGMGILDIFHALVEVGKTFVWFHSTATLWGGLLFMAGWWAKDTSTVHRSQRIPLLIAFASLTFGIIFLTFKDLVPPMVTDGEFTVLAKSLNILGGLGFLVAATQFLQIFKKDNALDDWLFAIHCTLFGSAGLLFEMSTLWDAGWWWWHALRLAAYITGLQCILTFSNPKLSQELPHYLPSAFRNQSHPPQALDTRLTGTWLPMIIVAVTIVGLLIGGMTLYLLQRHMIKKEGETLGIIAVKVSQQLEHAIMEHMSGVELLSHMPVFQQSDTHAMSMALRSPSYSSQDYVALNYVDMDGTVLASSRSGLIGETLHKESLVEAMRHGSRVGAEDIHFSPFCQNTPCMSFAAAVHSEGERQGMILGYVALSTFRNILDQTAATIYRKQDQSSTLEWQLLNQDGLLIIDSMLKEEGKVNLHEEGLPSAQSLTTKKSGYVEELHIRRNVPVISGYARTQKISGLPEVQWGVLVRKDRDQILSTISTIETYLTVIGIGIVFPLIGLLVFITRRLQIANDITTTAMEGITRSELQSRLIVEHALDAHIMIDSLGMITNWNEQAQQIFGWPREEILGESLTSTIMPVGIREQFSEDGLKPFDSSILDTRIETIGRRRNGQEFPIELAVSVIKTTNATQFSAFARDLSDRQEAEKQLQLLHQHNELILQSAGEGIYGLDANGMTTFVNQAALTMLGYASQELIGASMHATVHHSKADGSPIPIEESPISLSIKSGVTHRINEEVFWRKDGSSFPVEYISTPIRNTDGDTIGSVITFRNITERKINDQRVATEHEIAQILLNKSSLDEAGLPLIQTLCTNLHWQVGVFWKPSQQASELECAETFETSPGTHPTFIEATRKTTFPLNSGLPGQVWSDGKPSLIPDVAVDDNFPRAPFAKNENLHTGLACPVMVDGEIHAVMEFFCEESFIQDANLLTMMENIGHHIGQFAERKKAESKLANNAETLEQQNHELQVARDEALAAAKAKAEFLATMSHEIRTPLNGVIGMTDLLLETPLTEDQQDLADTVKHSGKLLLDLVNDILDFSKNEAGMLELEFIAFDLRTSIEEVIELFSGKASAKGLELTSLIYATTPYMLKGDPGRIRHILINLVANAIKFTKNGEINVQVWVEKEEEEQIVIRFSVTDTGIGLPEGAQDQLFESFTQADSSTTRKYGGTGLGLAICKQIVTLMKGSIGINSSEGEGSEFWFTVPFQRDHNIVYQPPARSNLQGIHLCLVESNDTVRFLVYHYAQIWGMRCTLAANASEALPLLQHAASNKTPCHVIIADQQLSDMSGTDFARLVKNEPLLTSCRLIMLSSLAMRGEARLARDAGCSAYLTKPVSQEHLYQCLTKVMGSSSQTVHEDHEESPDFITRHTLEEEQTQTRGHILIAEDNLVNQKVAAKMLKKLGYRVDVAMNGREATEAVNRMTYDAILMDCQMPEMDGYEATRKIREAEEGKREMGEGDSSQGIRLTSHVPIIALTANSMPGDRERCMAAGMDDFMSKPIQLDLLENTLRQWAPDTSIAYQDTHESQAEPQESIQANVVDMDELGPLDFDILKELQELGGEEDSDFLASIIDQFVQDIPRHLENISQAIEQQNADALMKAAHGFKGSCRNIGATPLADACMAMEQLGREGTTDGSEQLFDQIAKEQDRTRSALEQAFPMHISP